MSSIRGSSFYTLAEGPTWFLAEAKAINLGGHLVSINSESEQNWLAQWAPNENLWIGLTDSEEEGKWRWVNGDQVTYTYWDPEAVAGFANNTAYTIEKSNGVYTEGEDYVLMYSGSRLWNDGVGRHDHGISLRRGIAEIPLSYFSVSDLTLTEGSSGSVTITRTGGTQSTQNLTLISSNGTAAAGSDYNAISTTVSFAAGETSKTVSISTINDSTVESTESFNLTLTASSSDTVPAQISDGTAVVTVNDDDTSSSVTVNGTNNGIANAGTINNSGTINTGTINTNSGNTTNNTTNTTVNNTNIVYNYFTNTTTNVNSNNTTTNVNSNNTLNTWNIFRVDATVKVSEIVNQWFGNAAPTSKQTQDVTDTKLLDINASTWTDKIQINRVAKATDNGDILEALMPELGGDPRVGSVLKGGAGRDVISGRAGWDVLDGGDADDLIHGGNGRDIITGGAGRDELHGDFGWNTYKSEKDGVSDLIAIKSDQYLSNWIYGKAGNNADGSKCDIIEGLDAVDRIKIIGVDTRDITFAANVTAKGLTGIGIYGKGALEALYTGGDLTINQITQMTSGDASAAAMANQVNSYGTW